MAIVAHVAAVDCLVLNSIERLGFFDKDVYIPDILKVERCLQTNKRLCCLVICIISAIFYPTFQRGEWIGTFELKKLSEGQFSRPICENHCHSTTWYQYIYTIRNSDFDIILFCRLIIVQFWLFTAALWHITHCVLGVGCIRMSQVIVQFCSGSEITNGAGTLLHNRMGPDNCFTIVLHNVHT